MKNTKEEIEAMADKLYPAPYNEDECNMYCHSDVASCEQHAFIAGYTARDNEDRWISVNDRLPGDFTNVICSLLNGMIIICTFHKTNEGIWQLIGTLKSPYANNPVTHWQPLSQPPTE